MANKAPTATTEAKRTTITLRVTADELARVHEVATYHGLTVASVVRMLVTREARAIGVEPAKVGAR